MKLIARGSCASCVTELAVHFERHFRWTCDSQAQPPGFRPLTLSFPTAHVRKSRPQTDAGSYLLFGAPPSNWPLRWSELCSNCPFVSPV